jgi:hypothetical protein
MSRMDQEYNKKMGLLLLVAELKPATGHALDRVGREYGYERKSWLFGLIKESDAKYRVRIFNALKNR